MGLETDEMGSNDRFALTRKNSIRASFDKQAFSTYARARNVY